MSDMTDFKPYMIKASYDWIIDNNMSPRLIVATGFPEVCIPESLKGKPGDIEHRIILNIGPVATSGLQFDVKGKLISFHTRFSGVSYYVKIPTDAIEGIHAQETGDGAVFKMDYSKMFKPESEKTARPGLKLVK